VIVDGNYYVLEVNGSAGSGSKYTEYLTGKGNVVDGKALVKLVLKYVMNRDNWRRAPKEAGRVEWVKINGIGKLKAKLDTGNGAVCALHADDREIKDGKVTFTAPEGKKFTKDIVGYVQLKMTRSKEIDGKMRTLAEYEKRPLVLFDIEFDGKKYKNVRMSLDNRKNFLYPVLIGVKFMKKVGLMINPEKKFILKS